MFQRRILLALGISGLVLLMAGLFWTESEPTSAAGPPSIAVSAGLDHTCVVTDKSLVECWGDNDDGQLGDGGTTDSLTPVGTCADAEDPCTRLGGVAGIASGSDFTCALLTANDAVQCWGRNDSEQTGNSPCGNPCLLPVDVLAPAPPLTGVLELSAGTYHACALVGGGEVYCWGSNTFGRLGLGTLGDPLAAFRVCQTGIYKACVVLDDATSVSAGNWHTCAVTTGENVKCWGYNASFQLGQPTLENHQPNPVDVCVSGATENEDCVLLTDISSVAAGGDHTCAVTGANGVNCWGSTSFGQVGHTEGCGGGRCRTGEVAGLTGSTTAVATGSAHSCALNSSGGVQCWGANGDGQLGDGSNDSSGTPVDVVGLSSGVTAISATGNYTCALTDGAEVTCWGSNDEGQLGDGTTTASNVPVTTAGVKSGAYVVAAGGWSFLGNEACAIIATGRVRCWGGASDADPHDICIDTANPCTKLTNVAALAAGGTHNCALLNVPTVLPPDGREGEVKCWGKNTYGQLGDGTNTDRAIAVDVALTWPAQVGTIAIAAGLNHTCAVSQYKTVKCWGSNGFGQLGDSSTTSSNVPVVVSGGHDTVLTIAAGAYHTCFRTEDDTAMCWGHNDEGQLGDGTTIGRTIPVDVCNSGATTPCKTDVLTVAAELAAGMSFTCARTTTTGVLCWGKDSGGELGNGSGPESHVPDEVCADSACLTSLSGVTAIGAGWKHACAVKAGGVKCWGWNSSGQLGDDHECGEVACTAPVDVCETGASDPCGTNLLADISSLEAGGFVGRGYTCAVTTGNSLKCWGNNSDRQLGGPTTQQCGSLDCSTTPIDVELGATSAGAGPPPVPLPCSGGGSSSGDALLMLTPMIGIAFLSAGWRRRRHGRDDTAGQERLRQRK